jgi:hypothetical protein
VPPFKVKTTGTAAVVVLLIRSLLTVPLEFASNRVPPEFTFMALVFNRAVVEPALSIVSVPLLIVVAPVYVLAPVNVRVFEPNFVRPSTPPTALP